MGQCGCGEFNPDRIYRLPDGTLVAVQIYPGCEECCTPFGVQLHFFPPNHKGDFISEIDDIVDVQPDDFGACLPGIPIFSADDLSIATEIISQNVDPHSDDAYESISDYMVDNGIRLAREAYFICSDRCRSEGMGE